MSSKVLVCLCDDLGKGLIDNTHNCPLFTILLVNQVMERGIE